MKMYPTFLAARDDLRVNLLDLGHIVKAPRWQGIDVSTKPEMATRELHNRSFSVGLRGIEELDFWRKEIAPNLPWADAHFEERVGGIPLNPPPSHTQWPYAQNSSYSQFTKKEPHQLDERDWAYLAALIDGDGSITLHRRNGDNSDFRPRISVGQKDHDFVKWIGTRYPFGRTHFRTRRIRNLINGKTYNDNQAVWFVTRKSEVAEILNHILPYSVLKKEKVVEALELLKTKYETHADKPIRCLEEAKFSHTYPERLWPKLAGNAVIPRLGIRYPYGDLNDLVELLHRDPLTRQAYINIWNHEDTGAVHGGRLPCTLGYHYLMRHNFLHSTYYIRSCDFVRHYSDDIYLALRLHLWILDKLREIDGRWREIKPGMFTFHCVSLHCFVNDLPGLEKEAARVSSQIASKI